MPQELSGSSVQFWYGHHLWRVIAVSDVQRERATYYPFR